MNGETRLDGKHVALLLHTAHTGAWANVAVLLAHQFADRGARLSVLHLTPLTGHESLFPPGTHFTRVGSRSRNAVPGIITAIRRRRVDTLISFAWTMHPAAIAATWMSRPRPRLILNEGTVLSVKAGREHRRDRALRLLGPLARRLYPKADAVVCASTDILVDLSQNLRVDGRRVLLTVIPNPVDAEQVRLRAGEDTAEPVGAGAVRLVTVARHAAQKNLPLLLRAFAIHHGLGGRGRLTLVGSGPETDTLRRLAIDLGVAASVDFVGHLTNPFPVMAGSTCLVLSSDEEGFGLVLVEAMALGLPVIATACPGGPKEILGGGEYGLLVPPGDAEALAAAMTRICDDEMLRRKLAASGRTRAARYSPSRVADEWAALMGQDPLRSTGAGPTKKWGSTAPSGHGRAQSPM